MSDYAIEAHGLTKYYGSREIVSRLDLKVPRGSIFGFLGRNGAGKSTTIRMLMGLVEPTRGSATVLGYDIRNLPPDIRGRVGYMAEGHEVYDWMTVEQCRSFQSAFYSRWNDKLFWGVIDHFGLKSKAKAKHLSRGERAGLCLALTLAPEPELLILDDPALGLDPVARRSLLESMIYVTRKDDRTILFSSHLLGDVERVTDHIAVLDGGSLRADCSLETFLEHIRRFRLQFDDVVPDVSAIDGLLHFTHGRGETTLTIANYNEAVAAQLLTLRPKRIDEVGIGFEDAFIDFIGDRGRKSLFLDDDQPTH